MHCRSEGYNFLWTLYGIMCVFFHNYFFLWGVLVLKIWKLPLKVTFMIDLFSIRMKVRVQVEKNSRGENSYTGMTWRDWFRKCHKREQPAGSKKEGLLDGCEENKSLSATVKQKLHYQTIRWSAILGQLFLNIAVSHILTNMLFFAVPLAQILTSFLHILLRKLEKHNPQVLVSFCFSNLKICQGYIL